MIFIEVNSMSKVGKSAIEALAQSLEDGCWDVNQTRTYEEMVESALCRPDVKAAYERIKVNIKAHQEKVCHQKNDTESLAQQQKQ